MVEDLALCPSHQYLWMVQLCLFVLHLLKADGLYLHLLSELRMLSRKSGMGLWFSNFLPYVGQVWWYTSNPGDVSQGKMWGNGHRGFFCI